MNKLNSIKLYLLDMDGTIYLDNDLFDGTIDFLEYVKSIGGKYMFVTNNSSKSVDKYIEKLASLGIEASEDDFLTSTNATIKHLKEKGYKKIYALGTKSFREQLEKSGLNITTNRDDENIDCLCMGFDTELTFSKLEDACILLGKGVDYVSTNPDWVCPTWYGSVPDCGSVSQMISNATGRMPLFIGKPQPDMVYMALQKTGFKKEETAIMGDRLYTDIACGNNAGINTIFVLSGEGTMEDVEKSNSKPDYIFDNIRSLHNELTK